MVAGGKRVGAGKKPYSETGQEKKVSQHYKLSSAHVDHVQARADELGISKTALIEMLIQRDIDSKIRPV